MNELKKGSLANNIQAENGSISPKSCGCGHTCPAHAQAVPPLSVSSDYTGVGSAFASIKGRHLDEEDDLFSGSASSSGYESTTSTQSIDSFIGANFEGLAMRNNDSRSPSIDPLSNPSLDLGLVKIEDGEGE